MFDATAIVLAGGDGSRLNGADKARLVVDSAPVIEQILILLCGMFQEVLIVSNAHRFYDYPGTRSITDEQPGCGPLMGLCSGLKASANRINFVVACDLPFINPQLVTFIVETARKLQADVVVPVVRGYREPLMAVYNRAVLPSVEHALQRGRRKMVAFFDAVTVHEISEPDIAAVDPHLLSFININTPRDLLRARKILADRRDRQVS